MLVLTESYTTVNLWGLKVKEILHYFSLHSLFFFINFNQSDDETVSPPSIWKKRSSPNNNYLKHNKNTVWRWKEKIGRRAAVKEGIAHEFLNSNHLITFSSKSFSFLTFFITYLKIILSNLASLCLTYRKYLYKWSGDKHYCACLQE